MDQFRKSFSRFSALLLPGAFLLALASCGGGTTTGTNSAGTTISGFKKRILVANSFNGAVIIFNADNDLVWQQPFSAASGTNTLVLSPDKKSTILYSPTTNVIDTVDNVNEAIVGNSISLPSSSESIAWLSDNKTAVATARNGAVGNQPALGAIYVIDLTNRIVSGIISLPEARSLATNHAASKVLAFADDSNSVFVIDPTAHTATPIAGFDRPVNAIFSSDDSKAYILNCGPECGGTAASVQVLNMSDNSLGAKITVSAATTALLDTSGKLYVAGTANGVGQLDVVDTGSNTRTQTGIAIADGYHNRMAMADSSRLYIGAKNCSVSNSAGCLSIYNTGGTTAVIPVTRAPGIVTGIQPVIGRNLVYVTIGGELIIFDTTTDAPRSGNQFDLVGNAAGVLQID